MGHELLGRDFIPADIVNAASGREQSYGPLQVSTA